MGSFSSPGAVPALASTNTTLSDQTVTLRTGAGYKDNILLSHFAPQGSGFSRLGLDADYLRTSAEDSRFYLLLTGDDWFYWDNPSTRHEDLWTAAINFKRPQNDFDFETMGFYAFENQVLDLSSEENIDAPPAKVVGHTLSLRPAVRWNFAQTNHWLRFKWDVTRQFYNSPAISFIRTGPEIGIGGDYGYGSEWSIDYKPLWQHYDHARQTITGSAGADWRQRLEFNDSHYWDDGRHWQTGAQVFLEYNRDDDSGAFDYYRYGGSAEIRYSDDRWNSGVRVDAGRYRYLHLPVGVTDPAKWYLADVTVDADLRRTLTEWLTLFVEYEYERSLSNRQTQNYRANTVSAGLEWVF